MAPRFCTLLERESSSQKHTEYCPLIFFWDPGVHRTDAITGRALSESRDSWARLFHRVIGEMRRRIKESQREVLFATL
jgi:hypothetical protein